MKCVYITKTVNYANTNECERQTSVRRYNRYSLLLGLPFIGHQRCFYNVDIFALNVQFLRHTNLCRKRVFTNNLVGCNRSLNKMTTVNSACLRGSVSGNVSSTVIRAFLILNNFDTIYMLLRNSKGAELSEYIYTDISIVPERATMMTKRTE